MAGAEPVKIPTRTLGDRTDQHATVGVSRNRTPRRQDPGAGKFWNSVLFIFILYQRSHVYTWFKSQERISLAVQWLRTRLLMQGTQVRFLVRVRVCVWVCVLLSELCVCVCVCVCVCTC